MVPVSSSVRMEFRGSSWREVHPSCGGQWHITQGEEMHHAWLLGMVSQLCLTQRGEMLLQKGVRACVLLKQAALLNPVPISLFW